MAGVLPAKSSPTTGRTRNFRNGHFYALDLIERLGLSDKGGVIRIGFVHYSTAEEVDRVLEALQNLQ